jgi:glycosyltransferase involved in cell wall biosynthesis
MTLSIVIPTYGRVAPVARLLESISRQVVPPAEVIVVDQNEPEVLDACLSASGVDCLRVLRLHEANAALARNAGFAASSSTHVLFVDDDEVMPSDFVARVVDTLATHPQVRCLWPSIYEGREPRRRGAQLVRVARAGSGGVTFEREYFRLAGGYDEVLFRFARMAEDWELGLRMRRRGLVVWHDPSLLLRHDPRSEGGCAIRSAPYEEVRVRLACAIALVRRIARGTPFRLRLGDVLPIVRHALLTRLGRRDTLARMLRRPVWHVATLVRAIRESRKYAVEHADIYSDAERVDHLSAAG